MDLATKAPPTKQQIIATNLLAEFVAELKQQKIPISLSQSINFVNAASCMARSQIALKNFYWAGRTSLLSSPAHIHIYNCVFRDYWQGVFADETDEARFLQEIDSETNDGDTDSPDFLDFTENNDIYNCETENSSETPAEQEDSQTLLIRYSPTETLYKKDFAKLTQAEQVEAKHAIDSLKMTAPLRTSRRLKRGKFKSGQLDIKKIAKLATQTSGEPIRQSFLSKHKTNRRIVLLLDISGSMETYARVLLRFAHSTIASQSSIEAFTFGTRLTKITKKLQMKDPDLAISNAAKAVEDWSGGTRLGEMLEQFNNQWGIRGMARGAIVVILSDGWDTGDSQKLTEQMKRLSYVTHKIVWVNPLKATEGYEPLAKGMSAALPFIDNFVEGHSVFSLKKLAELIMWQN